MLTDRNNREYFIGNVFDNWESLRNNIDLMSSKLKIYDKAQNEKCRNCFAVGFCGFCPALHILDNDFKVTEQYQDTCRRIRQQTEHFLVQMAKIRTNSKKWNNLLKGIDLSFTDEMQVC
jgi:radical SAM protein with 4Fe4S-binding SPASM domain